MSGCLSALLQSHVSIFTKSGTEVKKGEVRIRHADDDQKVSKDQNQNWNSNMPAMRHILRFTECISCCFIFYRNDSTRVMSLVCGVLSNSDRQFVQFVLRKVIASLTCSHLLLHSAAERNVA